MKFRMVMHTGPLQCTSRKNFEFLMAAAAILKITKIAISLQRFDWSLWNLVRCCKTGLLTFQVVENFNFTNPRHLARLCNIRSRPIKWISKIQEDGQLLFWKPLNHHIYAIRFWLNLARWCPAPDAKFKFLIFDNLIWQIAAISQIKKTASIYFVITQSHITKSHNKSSKY